MSKGSDQRRFFRVPVKLDAELEHGKLKVPATVPDVCSRGFAVAIARYALPLDAETGGLEKGKSISVRLFLPDAEVAVKGELAWVRRIESEGEEVILAGVSLDDLHPETSRALKRWILGALGAIHAAANDVLANRWETAAESLRGAGYKDATREDILSALRYASTHVIARNGVVA